MKHLIIFFFIIFSSQIYAQIVSFEGIPIKGYVADFRKRILETTDWKFEETDYTFSCSKYKGKLLDREAILEVNYDLSKMVYDICLRFSLPNKNQIDYLMKDIEQYMQKRYDCTKKHKYELGLPSVQFEIRNSFGKQLGFAIADSFGDEDGYFVELNIANGNSIEHTMNNQIQSHIDEVNGIQIDGTIDAYIEKIKRIGFFVDKFDKRNLPNAIILKGMMCNKPVDMVVYYKGSLKKVSSVEVLREETQEAQAVSFYNKIREMLKSEYVNCKMDDDKGAYMCWPSLSIITNNGEVVSTIEGADSKGNFQVITKYVLF